MLGQVIGKVIKIDYNQESAIRSKFAGIAVELCLNKPLCSQFLLDGKRERIKYESLPTICFQCGRYDHKSEICPEQNTNENSGGSRLDGADGNHPSESLE